MLALCITGFKADPDTVTAVLGLKPTAVARKGHPGPSGRPHIDNGWWLDADEQRLVDGRQHDDALTLLLSHLDGREESFAQLRAEVQPKQITIYGGLYMQVEGQCGVWLEPSQMRLLAACGVGWGLDFFIGN